MKTLILFSIVGAALVCAERAFGARSGDNSTPATLPQAPNSKINATKQFTGRGIVRELKTSNTVVVAHGKIPGYMEAMTMPLAFRNPNEVRNLHTNDSIQFNLLATRNDFWIEKVQNVSASPSEMPLRQTFRRVREVDPLEVGQPMPDYIFTNQLGKPVQFKDYQGQALAVTFISTRCHIPSFCPRMNGHFQQVQAEMKKQANTNWHLFTLTFDPERDTSGVLQGYARRYGHDPKHWTFLTGAWIHTTAIAEQFGVVFRMTNETINHNLRAIVVGSDGKIRKIIPDNQWEPKDIVTDLTAASK